jgi:hypothetical protein
MDIVKKAKKAFKKKIEKKASVKGKLPPITCKCGCGSEFIPHSHKEHYFNAQHREDYYNRTYFSKTVTHKICPNDGKEFDTTKGGRQEYCCPECRIEAADKRRKGTASDAQLQQQKFYTDRYKQMQADGFKCRLCGRAVRDGVKLDVEDDEDGGKMTICNQCSEGRKLAR